MTAIKSTKAQAADVHAERTAELVGDGSQLTADTFATLGLAERAHLFNTNPDRYRELQAEVDRAVAMDLAARNGGVR
jgi:hypothetical protein